MAVAGLSASLYLDENAPPMLVADLASQGFDVVHAWEVGNRQVADEVHLQWAAEHGRAVFTFDLDDFPTLARRWTAAGRAHAGVIVSTQASQAEYGQLLRRLLACLDQWAKDDLVGQVIWLPPAER